MKERLDVQLHPLKGKPVGEIFPVLDYLRGGGQDPSSAGRDSPDAAFPSNQLPEAARSGSPGSQGRGSPRSPGADANWATRLTQAGREGVQGVRATGSKAYKRLSVATQATVHNKYLRKYAGRTNSLLTKIGTAPDPMVELGPGISTYH